MAGGGGAASKRDKAAASHSVNAELYAASHKPTSTMAMGLKQTHVAAQCWRDQVHREHVVAQAWRRAHDTTGQLDAAERDAVQQTLARQRARHAAHHSITRNPELYSILYNTDNSYHRTNYHVVAAAAAAAASSQNDSARDDNNNNSNTSDNVLATTTSAAIGAHATVTPAAVTRELLHGPRNTQRYLHARATAHTLHERYDDCGGPVTSSQVIGWAATLPPPPSATAAVATAAVTAAAAAPAQHEASTTSTTRHRRVGAYRTLVDDEHAALFGYRLTAH